MGQKPHAHRAWRGFMRVERQDIKNNAPLYIEYNLVYWGGVILFSIGIIWYAYVSTILDE